VEPDAATPAAAPAARHLADAEVQALASLRSGDRRADAWLAHLDLCDGCHSRVVQAAAASAVARGGAVATDTVDDARPRALGERTADGIYELGEVLAQGGMGRLFHATDTVLGRPVVLKVPRTEDPLLLWRFEREAAISAGLHHPGIAAIFAAGRFADGTPYYVMPIIDGQPLDRVMAGAVTMAERLALLGHLTDVCDAIGYAHAARVVHRDLKPNNVLVGAHAQTHVLDWGLAKRLPDAAVARTPRAPVRRRSWSSFESSDAPGGGADGSPTRHGDVIGTPGYMAPEQARGEEVDERADVYALGAMLAQLLTGRAPGPTQLAELGAAPVELQAIVARAMARARDQRYAHAGEMAAELRQYQTGQLVAAYAYRPWDHVRRFLGKHRVAVAAGALALVAVVVIAGLAFRKVDRARDRAEASERRAVASRAAAEELAEYMLVDLTDKADALGRMDLVEGIGAKIDAYYRQRVRPAPDDPGLARWSSALGNASGERRRRGDHAGARALADEAVALARSHVEATRAAGGAAALGARLQLAQALGALASAAYDEVPPTTRDDALAGCVATLADDVDEVAVRRRATCTLLQAELALGAGDLEGGAARLKLVDAGLTTPRAPGGDARAWLVLELNRAKAATQLAGLRGDAAEVRRLVDAQVATLRTATAAAPRDLKLLGQLAVALADLASTALRGGDGDAAQAAYADLRAATARMLAAEPADARWQMLDVVSLQGQARLAGMAGDLARADALYVAAGDELAAVLMLDASQLEACAQRGALLGEHASVLRALERPRDAQARLREAVQTLAALHQGHPSTEVAANWVRAARALAEVAAELRDPDADATLASARAVLAELSARYPALPGWAAERARLDAL
jgi:hypothetical protein